MINVTEASKRNKSFWDEFTMNTTWVKFKKFGTQYVCFMRRYFLLCIFSIKEWMRYFWDDTKKSVNSNATTTTTTKKYYYTSRHQRLFPFTWRLSNQYRYCDVSIQHEFFPDFRYQISVHRMEYIVTVVLEVRWRCVLFLKRYIHLQQVKMEQT